MKLFLAPSRPVSLHGWVPNILLLPEYGVVGAKEARIPGIPETSDLIQTPPLDDLLQGAVCAKESRKFESHRSVGRSSHRCPAGPQI
jgi:hypothetical protein